MKVGVLMEQIHILAELTNDGTSITCIGYYHAEYAGRYMCSGLMTVRGDNVSGNPRLLYKPLLTRLSAPDSASIIVSEVISGQLSV